MAKTGIPNEWDLVADRRYKRENMDKMMRGKIERGLVELITNPDDSYQDLEEDGERISGKIRIEIERRRKKQLSIVRVRDRACGMNMEDMYKKLGFLGKRTSGFEKGKARRGLHGRGAKDVAAFGTVHFESIKDGKYNHLIIPPSLRCHWAVPRPQTATEEIRSRLGIPKGNGTVVTVEVESRFKIPQHETLVTDFSRYFSLRDLFSKPNREVTIVDLKTGREDPLVYKYPLGEKVFDDNITIPNYPGVTTHFIIHKHSTPFEQGTLPYREGILVKSAAAVHDCNYFGLDSDPFSWRFTGESHCEFIDDLIREYDDREEENPDHPDHPAKNPMRLLDPFRDGLIGEHPFAQALYKKCKEILRDAIEVLKTAEAPPKRDVTDEALNRKLNTLSKEISKIFEKRLEELEEKPWPEWGRTPKELIEKLSIGLHIIPPEELPIIVNQPKTFSVIVKHYEALDESLPINVESSDPDDVEVRASPVYLKKFLEDGQVGTTTFTVEGLKVGREAYIEVRYDGYDNMVLVKTIESPTLPEVPYGLTFDKPRYRLRINKEKILILWLKTASKLRSPITAEITSDKPEIIVVKGGGKCQFHETDKTGVLIGKCRVLGRQLKAKGNITAEAKGFKPAQTRVAVEEYGGDRFKFKPVEDDFRPLRYKWDDRKPYLMYIGAQHSSIRKYLGTPTDGRYPGINSPLYQVVLAEVIAEALAFRLLEKQFKREGVDGMLDYPSTDAYYHRYFSEFLSVAHKYLA